MDREDKKYIDAGLLGCDIKEESLVESKDDILSVVEKEIGVSDRPIDGPSYILPNGKFLTIWRSKIPVSKYSATGSATHRDVQDFLYSKGLVKDRGIDVDDPDLEKLGCIRVNSGFEEYIWLPDNRPNETQWQSLLMWLDWYFRFHSKLMVGYYHYAPKTYYSKDYTTDEILKKCKEAYARGYLTEDINKYYRLEIEDAFGNREGLWTGAFNLIPTKETIENYPEDFEELTSDERRNYYQFDYLLNKLSKIKSPGVDTNFNGFREKDIFAFTSNKYAEIKDIINEMRQVLKELGFKLIVKELDVDDVEISYRDDDQIAFHKSELEKELEEKIVKKGNKWQVQSEKGKNLGTYDTKKEAEDRLKQVHYFKHINEEVDEFDSIVKTELDALNRWLDEYGFEVKLVTDEEELDYVDWTKQYGSEAVGMFLQDLQDNASVFPIALNKKAIEEITKEEDLDLKDGIEGTLWHEAGHGIYRFLEDTMDMPEDEEDCVEEFARYGEDSELFDILQDYMKQEESLQEKVIQKDNHEVFIANSVYGAKLDNLKEGLFKNKHYSGTSWDGSPYEYDREEYEPSKDNKYQRLIRKSINQLSLDEVKYIYAIRWAIYMQQVKQFESVEEVLDTCNFDDKDFESCYNFIHGLSFPLKIYRAIRVGNYKSSELNDTTNELILSGKQQSRSWTTDINIYKNEKSKFKDAVNIVSAEIDSNIIDIPNTIMTYMHYSLGQDDLGRTYGEYEITLKKNFKQSDLHNLQFVDKNNINESKADFEKFKQWCNNDELYNKFMQLRPRLANIKYTDGSKGDDIYYWMKNNTPKDLEDTLQDLEATPTKKEREKRLNKVESLNEFYDEIEDEPIEVTDDLYVLKNAFSRWSFRCCYDIKNNIVGLCELELRIHDDIDNIMSDKLYSDEFKYRFLTFNKKNWDENSLDEEIDYYGIPLEQYEYEDFYLVWIIERGTSFESTKLYEVLGKPIKKIEFVKESLNESKQDIEKFKQWAGDELANRFFAVKNRLDGKYKDIYYYMGLEKDTFERMIKLDRWKDDQERAREYAHKVAIESLTNAIEYLERKPTRKEIDTKGKEGAEKVYEDGRWLVMKINTYEASVKYGKHTQWCITGTNSQEDGGRADWENHTGDGEQFYFFIDKQKDHKYALEFKDMHNWAFYVDEDYVDVGEGQLFNNAIIALGDYWNPAEHISYPKVPTVEGLPDIQQAYRDAIEDHNKEFPEDNLNVNDFKVESLNEDLNVLDALDKEFGQEEVYMWSTYILPNGHFLNPDNSNWWDEVGYDPQYEHCDFEGWAYDKGYNLNDIYNNCIKMNVTYPYLSMPDKAKPTQEQLNAIRKILDRKDLFEPEGTFYWYDIFPEEKVNNKGANLLGIYTPVGDELFDLDINDADDIIRAITQAYTRGGFFND